jgi:hypothetical protein
MDKIIEWEKLWAAYANACARVDARQATLQAAVAADPTRWHTKHRQVANFAIGKARAAARRLYDFDKANNQRNVCNYEGF